MGLVTIIHATVIAIGRCQAWEAHRPTSHISKMRIAYRQHLGPPSYTKSTDLRIEVHVSPVDVAVRGLAANPRRAPMRRVAGQSSQRRGFYSAQT